MSQRPISTALLSYGMSGQVFHAPLIQSVPGFHLAMVVQRHAQTVRDRWPNVRVVAAAEEVLANREVELVVVNTPNDTHARYARKALLAGKHVVVEKPFTITVAEADDLIELAAQKKLVLTVFQNRRWDGDFLTVQQVLRTGQVGKVAEFEAHYDRFRNYIEPGTWKEQSGAGTGILYNLGSHMLDQTLVLFGLPASVDARIGTQREGGMVDDFYDIRLRYEGFLAIVKSSYLVREPGPRYALHGHRGSFVKYGLDPQEQALKEGHLPNQPGWGQEEKLFWGKLHTDAGVEYLETKPGNYPAFYQNVYQAIREGQPLAVPPHEARDVIRLIEACYQSNREQRAVAITT
jgi:predicted dehydrogenase